MKNPARKFWCSQENENTDCSCKFGEACEAALGKELSKIGLKSFPYPPNIVKLSVHYFKQK